MGNLLALYDVFLLLISREKMNIVITLYIRTSRAPTVVVELFFNVHGKHLRSCRDSQLTLPHFSWAGLDLLSG